MARAFAYRSALLKAREQSRSDCTARGSHGSSSAMGATGTVMANSSASQFAGSPSTAGEEE